MLNSKLHGIDEVNERHLYDAKRFGINPSVSNISTTYNQKASEIVEENSSLSSVEPKAHSYDQALTDAELKYPNEVTTFRVRQEMRLGLGR